MSEIVNAMLWMSLAAAGVAGLFLCCQQVMLAGLLAMQHADDMALRELLQDWRRFQCVISPRKRRDAVWLNRLLLDGPFSWSDVRERLGVQQRRVEQWLGWPGTLASLAQALGLLGTVCGLAAAWKGDPAQVISLAANTTIAGLVIAIPLIFVEKLVQPTLDRHLAQLSQVIDVVDESLDALGNLRPAGIEPALDTSLRRGAKMPFHKNNSHL